MRARQRVLVSIVAGAGLTLGCRWLPEAWAGPASALLLLAMGAVAAGALWRSFHESPPETARADFRAVFEGALHGMFLMTPAGRFVAVNEAFARLYGYRSAAHLMTICEELDEALVVDPGNRRQVLEALKGSESVFHLEFEIVQPDGQRVPTRENALALRDASGRLMFIQGHVEDVSTRWWREQRRRLQHEVAKILGEAPSLAVAAPEVLESICDILDWHPGVLWEVAGSRRRCAEVCRADLCGVEIGVFEASCTLEKTHAAEVLKNRAPLWGAPLDAQAPDPASRALWGAGMRTAFVVPVVVGHEVRYLMEFFSARPSQPHGELLAAVGAIARQVGHFVERNLAEDALRRSEMRKKAILESALDAIVSFDEKGCLSEFNPAAEQLFGFRQSEALGQQIVDLVIPERLRESHRRGIALYGAGQTTALGRRTELIVMRKDGVEVPVEIAVSRIVIDGSPMFTAYLRDVNDRKEAERMTSELAAVVANSNDAIVACASEGTIVSWNSAAERIYGYTAPEAVGRSFRMLFPADHLDEFPRTFAAIKSGESVADYETVRLRKDGRRIAVSVTESPIRSDAGLITGLSSIARDITERKRLEEDLLQSQKMDAVGRLAGGIAHDFNNILTAILGYSDLIIGQIDERQWMYRHLAEIRKAADFAASLTHQLLAFSRRQPLYLRVFNINDSVRNLLKMLERVIGERVKIEPCLDARIGLLKADQSQLEQVLLNLCVNARDAMPAGGTIRIHTEDVSCFFDGFYSIKDMPAGDYVKLSLSDSGTGIEPEVMKHIFEPFFTTKAQEQGTGLGLATCYGIVKQSGGYIAVESTVGLGTTFSIFLPRVNEAGEKIGPARSAGSIPSGTETILWVEDELAVRILTSHVLRRLGYTVIEAVDARNARDILEAHTDPAIDLLFSDVVLPDFGGRELANWAHKPGSNLRVLFTSGYLDENILQQHGLDSGTPFLQKPFTPDALAHKVREVLDGARE